MFLPHRYELSDRSTKRGCFPVCRRAFYGTTPTIRSTPRRAGSFRLPQKKWADFSAARSEEHTSELQSRGQLVCRLLLEKKKDVARSDVGRRLSDVHVERHPIVV